MQTWFEIPDGPCINWVTMCLWESYLNSESQFPNLENMQHLPQIVLRDNMYKSSSSMPDVF